uniref:RdRp n=1 Tax=viral metagenome TaxID=1070528 RepID=A0A2V0RAE6_9ZZZZ
MARRVATHQDDIAEIQAWTEEFFADAERYEACVGVPQPGERRDVVIDGVRVGYVTRRDEPTLRSRGFSGLRKELHKIFTTEGRTIPDAKEHTVPWDVTELGASFITSENGGMVTEGELLHLEQPRLRAWSLDALTEDGELAGKAHVDIRTWMIRRLAAECPQSGYAKAVDVACQLVSAQPWWREYYAYLRGGGMEYSYTISHYGNRYDFDDKEYVTDGPSNLMAPVRLMMTIQSEMYYRLFLKHSNVAIRMLAEMHEYLMVDPVFRVGQVRRHVSMLHAACFSGSKTGDRCIASGYDSLNATKKDRIPRFDRATVASARYHYSYIDEEAYTEAEVALQQCGLIEMRRFLLRMRRAEVRWRNIRDVGAVQTIMGISGYIGSHVTSAVADQLLSYEEEEPATDYGVNVIRNVFADLMEASYREKPPVRAELRSRRVLKFLTPRSAGRGAHTTVSGEIAMPCMVIKDDGTTVPGHINRKVSAKLHDKRGFFLRYPHHSVLRSAADDRRPSKLGSRIVPGGRPVRIIFPVPLEPYLRMYMAQTPMNAEMGGANNLPATHPLAQPGGGNEHVAPHEGLAFLLEATGSGHHLTVAADFKTYDASHTREVGAAEHEGMLIGLQRHRLNLLPYSTEETWLNDSFYQLQEAAYPPGGPLHSYIVTSQDPFPAPTVETDMLSSGVPNTFTSNTGKNIAFEQISDERIAELIPDDMVKPLRVTGEKMGDDTVQSIMLPMGFKESDLPKYGEMVKEAIAYAARHTKSIVSFKRLMISTIRAEHKKIGVVTGHALPNYQMQVNFSEKTENWDWPIFQKVSTLIETLQMGMTRYVDPDAVFEYIRALHPLISDIKTEHDPDRSMAGFVMHVSPFVWFCTSGGGLNVGCPILPRGSRLYTDEWFLAHDNAFRRMCKTAATDSVRKQFAEDNARNLQIPASVNTPPLAPADRVQLKNLSSSTIEMMPEYSGQHLFGKAIKDLTLRPINQMSRNQILNSAFTGKWAPASPMRRFKTTVTKIEVAPMSKYDPYPTVDGRLRVMFRMIGLSHKNTAFADPAQWFDRQMAEHPSDSPGHLDGYDVLKIFQTESDAHWDLALRMVGFGSNLRQIFVTRAANIKAAVEMGIGQTGYYAGPLAFMNMSADRLSDMTDIPTAHNLHHSREARMYASLVAVDHAWRNIVDNRGTLLKVRVIPDGQ